MKNISLYTLKLILSALLSIGFFMSCTEKDPVLDTDSELPRPSATEVLVRLLIKGESILPPKTKQMTPDVEGSFKTDLQLLILKKEGSTYNYECSRAVESTSDGSFAVKVPTSLGGSKLKFLLFANSTDLIGDPDVKFKKDGKGVSEEVIRTDLIMTLPSKWPIGDSTEETKKIPMWSEDQFTFTVNEDGASSPSIAHLNLLRMLARVDVGLGYRGSDIGSTAAGIDNFVLEKIKVYHTGNKGQLMPNPSTYVVTEEGSGKKIQVTAPSIPLGNKVNIEAYEILVATGMHASERSIYLFEQAMSKVNSSLNPCILVYGTYTAPASLIEKSGWYRLDFYNFGGDKQFRDVLRNTLYRFNIIGVKGAGFATETDALNSTASNMTVELIPFDLQHNETEFDKQYFLSVDKSELFFYADKNKARLSLGTNYSKWTIDFNGVAGITATPNEGLNGSAVVEFTYIPSPRDVVDEVEPPHIFIVAGNLKKKISIRDIRENAPGNLSSFSLSPSVLYFPKEGASASINIESNIFKKYLSKTSGKLKFTIPSEIAESSFLVAVEPYTSPISNLVESGLVNVNIKAANADITASSEIKQLTYTKSLDCKPGIMEHGVGSSDSKARMSIQYDTSEPEGSYLIKFNSPTGDGFPFTPTASGMANRIEITALPNKTSRMRNIGKLTFYPAINGVEIPLLGHPTKEIMIQQEPVPAPTVKIQTSNKDLDWNVSAHSFTVSVDTLAFVKNNHVSISRTKGNSIDMNIPAQGSLNEPINFTMAPNRSSSPKKETITTTVEGWWGYHQSEVTFTQAPPTSSTAPSGGGTINVGCDDTFANLQLSNLNNIFEVLVEKKESGVTGSTELQIDQSVGQKFTLDTGKKTASLELAFTQNESDKDRSVKIKTKAIGNIASEVYNNEFIVIQSRDTRGNINILGPNPVNIPYYSTSHTFQYDSKNMGDLTVIVSPEVGVTSRFTATLDRANKSIQVTYPRNTSMHDERAYITLSGYDLSGKFRSSSRRIVQARAEAGVITLSPTILKFSRNETVIKASSIVKEHILGEVRVGDKPDWIQTAEVVEGNLRILPKENLGHARSGDVYISGVDATGVERSASITVNQESNIVRVSDQQVTSPYLYNEGGGNQTHPSFYINVETNSLPFTSFTATPDSWDNVHSFTAYPSRVSNLIGKQVEIALVPMVRDNAYGDIIIPVTMTFATSEGVSTKAKLSVIRKGHPSPQISASYFPKNYGAVPPNKVKVIEGGYINTSNLKSSDYLSVNTYPLLSTGQVVRITTPTGAPVPSNYRGYVKVHLLNQSASTYLNPTIEIVAKGVDGREREIIRLEP